MNINGLVECLLVEFSSCTPGLCGLTVSGRFDVMATMGVQLGVGDDGV